MSLSSRMLLGRSAELGRIDPLLDEVVAGAGHAVLLDGDPGCGKTALLGAVLESALRRGIQLFSGCAEEIEQHLPFAAVSGALDLRTSATDWRRAAIAHQIRHGGRLAVPVADRELVVVESILSLLDELCVDGPLALVMDDLHWADTSSVQVLHQVGKALRDLPVLLIGAARSVPRTAALEQLRRSLVSRGGVLVSVGPLPPAAVRELAEQVLGASVGPVLLELLGTAGGNALYVRELLDGLLRHSGIVIADGTAEATVRQVPGSLSAAILDRLDFLTPRTTKVLGACALLGSGHTVTEIAVVTGQSVPHTTAALADAVAAGVLIVEQDRLVFQHDLIRQALHDAMPAPLRAVRHLEAGLALASAGVTVERVAEQLTAGEPSGDARVLAWLSECAEQLALRMPETAVALLGTATALGDPADPLLARLRVHLACALMRCGQVGAAEDQARRALAARPEPGDECTLRWLLAHAPYADGRPDLALAEIRHALDSPAVSPLEATRFRAFASVVLFTLGEFGRAEGYAWEAERQARELGDTRSLVDAYETLAVVHRLRGHSQDAMDFTARALRLAPAAEITGDRLIALHLIRAYALLELGRAEAAEAETGLARRIAEQRWGTLVAQCQLDRAVVLLACGNWDDALAEVRSGPEPDERWEALPLHSLAAIIEAHRGNLAAARGYLDAVAGTVRTTTGAPFYEFLPLWAHSLVELCERGPQEALRRFLATADRGLTPKIRASLAWLYPGLVGLALDCGNRALAERLTVDIRVLLGPGSGASLHAVDQHCQGLLHQDPAALREATRLYQGTSWVLFRGRCEEDLAAVLAATGEPAAARAPFDAALAVYLRLGADWDMHRAESRLRAHGVHRGARGTRSRPKTGLVSLTETERRVAELVAAGLSNPAVAERLFVSRRTVQFHVSNILAKLGLSSRVELATLLAREPEGTG
ncbi:ATP-binding protein [Crossiella sp. CA198]|uniref:ATP-binding protein n=1 Tax=Crossiella sp. CA198 TaxID=3455607 RepID=UPI003F8D7FD5